jgi:hypothetical protein
MKSHKRPTFTSKNLKDGRCSARRPFSTIKPRVSPIGVIGRSQRRRLEPSFQRLDFGPCYLSGALHEAHRRAISCESVWACLPPVTEEHSVLVCVIKSAQGGTVFAVSDTLPFAEAEQRQAMGPRRASLPEALPSPALIRARPPVAWTTDSTSNTVP